MSVKCCVQYQDSSTAIPAKDSAYGRELLAVISHPKTISQLTRLLGHPPGWLTIGCFLRSIQSLPGFQLCRHRQYGIKPQYLCLFQLSILNTLADQLNGLSLHSEIAWSVAPWLKFIGMSGKIFRVRKNHLI